MKEMRKLGVLFLFGVLIISLSSFIVVGATDNRSDDCGGVDCDKLELEVSAGTTPDSAFYFVDEFFDNFGNSLEIREEKVAEIKAMIEAGNFGAARTALENYKSQIEGLEQEVDPANKDEAVRSSNAIQNTLKDLENLIPEDERGKFVDDVVKSESAIVAAAEIASKIKELCIQLAELDPTKYSEVCGSGDDSPTWKKKLDKDLTKEQRDEAKKFGKIMSDCFKSSGKDCDCKGISFYDFSVACEKAASLATSCDLDGDEKACDDLDNLDMPELPDYLQDVFDDIESQFSDSKYDMYMPKECIEAGAKNPNDCGKIMVKEHAPLECKAALLEADINSEREGREICDKIMFELHAPKECVDEGITNPDECGKFMDSFRGPGGPNNFIAPGKDCMQIEDKMERLDCFENAVGNMGESYGVGERFEDGKGEITWQCKENRIHWAPDCKKFMEEEWPEQEKKMMEKGDMRREQEQDWRVMEKECASSCGKKAWDFREGRCICKDNYVDNKNDYNVDGGDNYVAGGGDYNRQDNGDRGSGDVDGGMCQEGDGNCNNDVAPGPDGIVGVFVPEPRDDGSPPVDSGSSDGGDSSVDSGSSDSGSSDSGSSDGGSSDGGGDSGSSDGGEVTGSVISGNAFLEYYYR